MFRVGVAVVLAAGAVLAHPVPARADNPHVTPLDPLTYDDLDALIESYGAPDATSLTVDPTALARCGTAAPDPLPDGQPITVVIGTAPAFTVGLIKPATWKNPPVADPSWRLNFQGLMWMRSLARRAAQDDQQQSLAALVAQSVEFHQDNPDTGGSTYGWDEGTAMRRLEAQNCLYSVTQAAALIPGMTADAAVLFSKRYYGPPLFAVHNHGLMANLQLVRAGDLLNKPAWTTAAVKRMVAEAPLAFSRAGLSFEQASDYQAVNASLWGQAAQVLSASPSTAKAAVPLVKAVAAAWAAFSWETEPDGKIVQIGDSDETNGLASALTVPRVLRDDQTGTAIGRWSWTDPLTTYYTIRYGPPRRAHGHEDRAGGVTWTTLGTRVLVGPGKYTYDKATSWYIWTVGPSSHNVAVPDGAAVRSGKTAKVTASTIQAAAHAWAITDDVYNTPHTRGINVNRDARRIQVSDAFPKAALWRQHWHLAPGWTLTAGKVGGTALIFRHPSGRRLTMTTTGRVSGVINGSTTPISGWHFPIFGTRTAANEVVVRSYGRADTTTFTVA